MRIGIDARLHYFTRSGISLYAARLVRALVQLDALNTYVLIRDRRDGAPIAEAPNLVRFNAVTPAHNPLEAVAFAADLARAPIDLFHATDFVAPTIRRIPAVVTIHDLGFMLFPETITEASRRYYRRVDISSRRAEAIIAVSERTRRDIIRLLHVRPEKVHVVYHAADPIFMPRDAATVRQRLARWQLPDPFVLFVGTIEPRKNLTILLAALESLLMRGRELGLVLAGSRGWLSEDFRARLVASPVREQVRWIEDPDADTLVDLYNGARALVLPSRHEGFGFPVLEAMACGTPVICSNAGALPEVAGNAALLFAPDDAATLAGHLERVLDDAAAVAELRSAGLTRAAMFSWEATARATLAVYESLLV